MFGHIKRLGIIRHISVILNLRSFLGKKNISWYQPYQNGVVQCLADRDYGISA